MSQHTVIIGGTSGIGLATAGRLARNGHTVTVVGRDPQRLAKAVAELGGSARGEVADARDRSSLDAVFEHVGSFDNLVVAATANGGAGALANLDLDEFRAGLDGKLVAHVTAIQAALPTLRENGSITLVSAGSAQSALPGTAGLAAINGAIETMVPVLAVECAPARVNAVSPGVINTSWWDWMPAEDRAEAFASYAATTPAGRVGVAEDVADAIAFLIGNTFVTGTVLPCDGGLRLTNGR